MVTAQVVNSNDANVVIANVIICSGNDIFSVRTDVKGFLSLPLTPFDNNKL
jgi:hypothetical protein